MTKERRIERKEPFQPHPLEGKYIIYLYTEQDQESDLLNVGPGQALALYKLQHGKLKEVYHPRDHFLFMDAAWMDNEGLIKFMKKKKITEVITVFSEEYFFGLPDFINLDGSRNKSILIGKYCRYDPLDKSTEEDSEIIDLLKKAGVNVRSYDEDKKKFLD